MSSDSDDDCYGNVAQALQALKNKYVVEKPSTSSLLDDSEDLDQSVTQLDSAAKTGSMSSSMSFDDEPGPSVSNECSSQASTSKRGKRSVTKRSSSGLEIEKLSPTRKKRRYTSSESRTRGRGRARGTKSKNRRSIRGWFPTTPIPSIAEFLPSMTTIYPIGDAEEVYDKSEGQALFSNKNPDEVIEVEDTDPLDENEEMSVKVYWQSCDFFKFTIRKFQKLSQIFDHFSEKYDVVLDKLLFTYNDRILKPDDTPDTIEYSIAKFIEGGILTESLSLFTTNNRTIGDGPKIKFQCENVKKPFEIAIKLEDKLSVVMAKCAEHIEMPLNKLRFVFDGDYISGKSTGQELELEGGECIDVKIIS